MVRLREIQRTAAFAWSPAVGAPWIVTGTKSGAVDVDFSNETCLELWELDLDSQGSNELQPKATVPTEIGFHDLAWTPPTDEHPKGIIAGALDDGTLALWDAEKLQSDPANASIYSKKVHSGAIKALQYNPHPKFSHYLATAGAKGELFIVDLSDLESDPIRLGTTAARADDFDCLDWNKKVPNILVTGSSGGFVTVWDLKTKKESLTLNNYGRKAVSAVAWDPEKPTRLMTAVPLEQEPVILVWDLRNSNAPEKVLRGHDSGVLSLAWCPQDNDLLLSCGKDNRTILWNPQTAQAYGDFPVVTNWTFSTRWNPRNPSMFATASFDGKISIQSLQNTNPSATQREQVTAGDGEDFFSKAQTQPQTSSFSLSKAPKWLERPCSVSFGFGGHIISVNAAEPGKRASKITITKFEVDSEVGAATNSFEEAMQSGNLDELCDTRAADAKTDEEKADWHVMKTLLSQKPREELVKYLGFDETSEVADNLAKAGLEDKADENDELKPQVNGGARGHRRFESVFATDADGDFLSQLAATKGTATNSPFQIFSGAETEADKQITKLVMLGKFNKALDICLAEDRMSDAFMLAICGGEACIKKAQEAYFAKQGSGPNYLRLLASVVGKNLWDTVHNADLENWKGIMATMCTFADEKEFPDLCEALGDRLDSQTETNPSARKDAAFCYLAGSKLEKVINIWISEVQQHEEEGAAKEAESSAFSVHAKALQDLIEKVTIFRKVVNFQDDELQKTGDWKLEALYNKYLEYSDIVAAHGQLEAASKYLSLLPVQYPEADVARSRIQKATKKAPVPTVTRQSASAAATPQKPLPNLGFQQPSKGFSPAAPVPSPFAPQQAAPAAPASYNPPGQQPSYAPSNPYQPQGQAQPNNPYAPAGGSGGYQPPQPMRASVAPPPPFGMHAPPSQFGAPPRNMNQSPSVPPPSQAKDMKAWNDLPDDFARVPTPRRGTPSVAPQQAPSNNQFFNAATPPGPSGTPFGSRPQKAVPPPPKAGEMPPPRIHSPQISGAEIRRPGSSATNAYAPQQPTTSNTLPTPMQPPVARGPSPFAAPPSGGPPPNRYAPAPGAQSTANAPPAQRIISPPPQGGQFAGSRMPSNPYAPGPQSTQPASSPYAAAPPPQNFAQAPPPQRAGPPPAGPPPAAQREAPGPGTAPSTGTPATAAPAARKHPKGDRSHIPANAQPIYQILGAEMARIEPRAPSSYAPQVRDTAKRLDILYDHLNNEDLIKPDTVERLFELATAIQNQDFGHASEIQQELHVNKVEECGQWMVGVKRLISMGRAIQN